MKSILISIQPKWVEKILNGEKTIEIRRNRPNGNLPFKVLIYCTKSKPYLVDHTKYPNKDDGFVLYKYPQYGAELNGKVVAEFTLNKVDKIGLADHYSNYGIWLFNNEKYLTDNEIEQILKNTCLDMEQVNNYLGYGEYENGKFANGYFWHIENLKIYDKPKELSDFDLIKAPQSWCYVEYKV